MASVLGGLILSSGAALAQPSLTARLGGSLDSFAESGQPSQTRGAAAAALGAEYWFADERGHLYYQLNGGRHSYEGDWRFLVQEGGLVYGLDLGDETRRLYLGASGTLRGNGEAWSAADYRAAGAMANFELRLRPGATVRFGYHIDARRFPDIPELDQLEQGAFASVLFNLPTRTTLVGELHFGVKSYRGETLDPATATPQGGSQSHGRGMGPGLRRTLAPPGTSAERAQALSGLVRLAQSLATRTGASLELSWRNVGGSVPPAVVTTPPGFFDDGVYDDPFASSALRWRLSLKHVFGSGATLETSASWLDQEYTASVALQPDGSPVASGELRADRVWHVGTGIRLPVLPGRTGPVVIDAETGYSFVHHRSNDAFYNYTSHVVGAALVVTY